MVCFRLVNWQRVKNDFRLWRGEMTYTCWPPLAIVVDPVQSSFVFDTYMIILVYICCWFFKLEALNCFGFLLYLDFVRWWSFSVLFYFLQARIHPEQSSATLSKESVGALHKSIKEVRVLILIYVESLQHLMSFGHEYGLFIANIEYNVPVGYWICSPSWCWIYPLPPWMVVSFSLGQKAWKN